MTDEKITTFKFDPLSSFVQINEKEEKELIDKISYNLNVTQKVTNAVFSDLAFQGFRIVRSDNENE